MSCTCPVAVPLNAHELAQELRDRGFNVTNFIESSADPGVIKYRSIVIAVTPDSALEYAKRLAALCPDKGVSFHWLLHRRCELQVSLPWYCACREEEIHPDIDANTLEMVRNLESRGFHPILSDGEGGTLYVTMQVEVGEMISEARRLQELYPEAAVDVEWYTRDKTAFLGALWKVDK